MYDSTEMIWEDVGDWLSRLKAEPGNTYAVFLHGWGADIRQGGLWHLLGGFLAQHGISSLLIRLPYAAGETGMCGREEILHRIRSAESLIQREGGRIVWRVGFSMGALIASHTRDPSERLLLLSPAWLRMYESIFLPHTTLSEKIRILTTGKGTRIRRDLLSFFKRPRLREDDWIIHGWYDQLIPAIRSIRLAYQWKTRLVLVPANHSLQGEEERIAHLAYSILISG